MNTPLNFNPDTKKWIDRWYCGALTLTEKMNIIFAEEPKLFARLRDTRSDREINKNEREHEIYLNKIKRQDRA